MSSAYPTPRPNWSVLDLPRFRERSIGSTTGGETLPVIRHSFSSLRKERSTWNGRLKPGTVAGNLRVPGDRLGHRGVIAISTRSSLSVSPLRRAQSKHSCRARTNARGPHTFDVVRAVSFDRRPLDGRELTVEHHKPDKRLALCGGLALTGDAATASNFTALVR